MQLVGRTRTPIQREPSSSSILSGPRWGPRSSSRCRVANGVFPRGVLGQSGLLIIVLPQPSIVLAYHGLGNYARRLDPHNLMVPQDQFRRQMDTSRHRGYRFVRLRELTDLLVAGALDDGVCALTFDDGTVDNLEVLAPLLTELDLPATVFVCPGLLGELHFAMPAQADVRLM